MDLHRAGVVQFAAQKCDKPAVVQQHAADFEHIAQAPGQLKAWLLATAGAGAGHPAASVADFVALHPHAAARVGGQQQAANLGALHRLVSVHLHDFQRLQAGKQVVYAAGAVLALVAHRAGVVGAVSHRAHHLHAAVFVQKTLLRRRQSLAAVEHFFDATGGLDLRAVRRKQPEQVRCHADQRRDLVRLNLLGDLVVLGHHGHRVLAHLQVFQDGPKADEAAVQIAGGKQVHHPVGGWLQTGGHQAVGGDGHLLAVVRPAVG